MASSTGLTIFLYIVYVTAVAGFAVGLAGGIMGVVLGNTYGYFGLSIASIVLACVFPWAGLVTGAIVLDDLVTPGRPGKAFSDAYKARQRSAYSTIGQR